MINTLQTFLATFDQLWPVGHPWCTPHAYQPMPVIGADQQHRWNEDGGDSVGKFLNRRFVRLRLFNQADNLRQGRLTADFANTNRQSPIDVQCAANDGISGLAKRE